MQKYSTFRRLFPSRCSNRSLFPRWIAMGERSCGYRHPTRRWWCCHRLPSRRRRSGRVHRPARLFRCPSKTSMASCRPEADRRPSCAAVADGGGDAPGRRIAPRKADEPQTGPTVNRGSGVKTDRNWKTVHLLSYPRNMRKNGKKAQVNHMVYRFFF